MKLIEILNCDSCFGIGKKNDLLFRLPKDMEYFRKTTLNHVVALGENTLLSFPNSKPLKNRKHIVISANPAHNYENVVNVHTFDDFKNEIKKALEVDDVYIIGGASIYNAMLPYVDEVLLNKVKEDGGAEVFYTNLDEHPSFKLVEVKEEIEDNGHITQLHIYKNINKEFL